MRTINSSDYESSSISFFWTTCWDVSVCERRTSHLGLFSPWRQRSSSDIAQSSGTDAGTTSVASRGVRNIFSSSLCAVSVVTSNSSSDFVGNGLWTRLTKCWSCWRRSALSQASLVLQILFQAFSEPSSSTLQTHFGPTMLNFPKNTGLN